MIVVGLAIRTTNAAEADPSTAKIGQLWGQFVTEGWASRLEKVGAFGPAVAVYSAYERDATGSYQVLIGRQVPRARPVSTPLHVVSTPPGSYLVFRCAGPLPQAIIDGWRDVWAHFARDAAPARAYTADFEIYADAGPPEIWVSTL